ncbi:MAG: hypothetical protein AAFQ66_09470 [Pseudomonadota bacterium]
MTAPKGPLEKPEDWEDFSVQWRRIKAAPAYAGKVPPRYHAEEFGFDYWIEVEGPKILTSDPSIFMSFHAWGAHGYEGHSYAMLHDGEDQITITSQCKGKAKVRFSRDLADKTDDGTQIWRVDELFRRFSVPDHKSYPWVSSIHVLPTVEIGGIDGFRNQAHQERVICLIKTLLSCKSGSDIAALRGEVTSGKAVFGERLRAQLRTGALIKSAPGE